MLDILQLPSLSGTPIANLAGILPLGGLIEFVDVVTKLHSYELSGGGFLWNWPITPSGARLLLGRSKPENEESRKFSCVLDGEGHIPPIHCVDGKWGDNYVCQSRFTIRECIRLAPFFYQDKTENEISRPQYLEVIYVKKSDGEPNSHHYWDILVHTIGWLLWIGIVVVVILTPRPYALAYLATLPITGLLVRILFGNASRLLRNTGPSESSRMVIVTENFNATNWSIFLGDSDIINSLLNKSFKYHYYGVTQIKFGPKKDEEYGQGKDEGSSLKIREDLSEELQHLRLRNILRFALRLVISGQWAMVIAASAMQDWDAIWISVCIVLCACISTFIHSPSTFVEKWLRSNNVTMEKARLLFSHRHAMLSAMVALSPDMERKKWIDPILAESEDRSRWQAALDNYINTNSLDRVGVANWSAIREGVDMANKLRKIRPIPRNEMLPPKPTTSHLETSVPGSTQAIGADMRQTKPTPSDTREL